MSFTESIAERLRLASFSASEVSTSPENEAFGNSQAVFRVGSLLLRFTRDRGQEFMDLGSAASSGEFHQFDDVEIAMGWRTIDEVLAKREPDALDSVLARLMNHLAELESAMSGERERFTKGRIERAARERGEAFVRKLRSKPQSP